MKVAGKVVAVVVKASKDGSKNYVDVTIAESFDRPVAVLSVEPEAHGEARALVPFSDVEAEVIAKTWEGNTRLSVLGFSSAPKK